MPGGFSRPRGGFAQPYGGFAQSRGGFAEPKGGFAGSGAEWSPTQISGLVDWHRADLGITLVSTKVSSWADQSGGGHTLSQGTDANRPEYISSALGGKPVVRFGPTATDKILSWSGFTQPSAVTVFAVITLRTTAADQLFIETGSVHPFLFLGTVAQANKPLVFEGSAQAIWGSALSDQTGYLVKWSYDYSHATNETYAVQVNNGTEVTGSSALSLNTTSFTGLGRSDLSQDLISDVAEIAIYSKDTSAGEDSAFWAYARARYGL